MILPWEAERLRIYMGESDRVGDTPLYQAIAERARQSGAAGVTVLRGIMGYGANSRLRSDDGDVVSADLPIVVEIVDRPDRVRALMVELQEDLRGGLVTLETVRVVTYRADEVIGMAHDG